LVAITATKRFPFSFGRGMDLDSNAGLLSDGLLVRFSLIVFLPRWWWSVMRLRAFLAAARRFLISAMHSLHCEAD
jgi:hypothetical protein